MFAPPHATRPAPRLRTTLLYSISHDLRSPLTAIRLIAETLRSSDVDAGLRDEMLADVEREADRLTQLLSHLVDAARLEDGVAIPHRVRVPVGELCRSAISLARPTTGGGRVELAVQPGLGNVEADETMLQQVLVNLLENAANHDPGTLGLEARELGTRVELRVSDHGPGVPEHDRLRIFEPFERLRAQRPGSRRGTGLGLAVARGFVEAHDGTIHVETTPGGGATFVVSLPYGR